MGRHRKLNKRLSSPALWITDDPPATCMTLVTRYRLVSSRRGEERRGEKRRDEKRRAEKRTKQRQENIEMTTEAAAKRKAKRP